MVDVEHGSYLQGMETFEHSFEVGTVDKGVHGSYLQGMETRPVDFYPPASANGTDPTYKEWKPAILLVSALNSSSTDPTYKEWKLFRANAL